MKTHQEQRSTSRGSKARQVSPSRFPALRALLRGYLHEDFAADYGTAEAAVRAFSAEASPDQVRDVTREWQRFSVLTASWTISDVRETLSRDLGAAWHPATRRELQQAFDSLSRRSG
jgi:hypothetical protein